MGLRPQTLYGIADSPVGLAAYFLDHDARSYELIARVFDGQTEGLTRDDILDNITLTWLTNTAISGARLYWENKGASFFAVKGVGVAIPVAVSVFPDELYPAPRSWAERAYPKLIHYNKLDKGGPLCGLGTADNSSQKRFARASGHCANSGARAPCGSSRRGGRRSSALCVTASRGVARQPASTTAALALQRHHATAQGWRLSNPKQKLFGRSGPLARFQSI